MNAGEPQRFSRYRAALTGAERGKPLPYQPLCRRGRLSGRVGQEPWGHGEKGGQVTWPKAVSELVSTPRHRAVSTRLTASGPFRRVLVTITVTMAGTLETSTSALVSSESHTSGDAGKTGAHPACERSPGTG